MKSRCSSVAEWVAWVEWVEVVAEMDLGLVVGTTIGETTRAVDGEIIVEVGATKATMALLTRVVQVVTTRVAMATKAHGKVVPPTTRVGTTKPTRVGAHKLVTMVAHQTTGVRDLATSATTTDRAMVVDP